MPRRKIAADTGEIDASTLPELTAQRQEFVRLILSGKSYSDAYRGAFTTDDWSPNAVWVAASRLAADADVRLWLAAARQACLGTHVLTRESHQQQLERLREIAIASGNVGAAVKAEELRGKVAGHQVERVQEIPHDPADTLRHIAEHQPDLAAQLAQAHGIPWDSIQNATKH